MRCCSGIVCSVFVTTYQVLALARSKRLDRNLKIEIKLMTLSIAVCCHLHRSYSRALLINNAGSLGELTPVDSISSLATLQSAIDFNVTSAMWLTSQFVKHFATAASASGNEPNVVINVSSLAAIKPFETWGIYCAGKAARDMFTATLALEQSADNTWKTLNYSPGPLDTVMQEEIRNSTGCNAQHRETFKSMHTQGQLVDPAVSAEKCIAIVLQNKYTSGSHVDYYDDTVQTNDTSRDPRKALSKAS
jgi:sepiapterin reductase